MAVEQTNAFKAQLAAHIRTVVADPRARVFVGAYGRPEAVLMSVAADVPAYIRRILLDGAAITGAEEACRGGHFMGLGDDAGTILAWLWEQDHGEALAYLADLVRHIQARVSTAPLSTILDSIPTVLPPNMSRAEIERLTDHAKQYCDSPGAKAGAAGVGHAGHTDDHAGPGRRKEARKRG